MEPGTQPLLLVHGTTADHLTFRVVGPMLGRRRRLHAIDRRGRGASGDSPRSSTAPPGLAQLLRAPRERDDRQAALETFMREVVGMDDAGVARFRADPVWPLPVAASPTTLRALDGAGAA